MTKETFRTACYPLNGTGIDLTFVEIEYEIIEQLNHLIKAKFVNIHHKIDDLSHIYYKFPSFFTIDTQKEVLLNEEGEKFARTTILKERN